MSQPPENPSADQQHAKQSPPRVLRSVRFYLAIVLLLFVAAGIDSCRKPSNQAVARVYVRLVRGYQWGGRPVTSKVCRCRFEPTCSQYSIEAVERFGIRKGLWLTVCRVCRCKDSAPLGTRDPVPAL